MSGKLIRFKYFLITIKFSKYFQYKRDDGIYDNHMNGNGTTNNNQLAYFNNRYERRLSVESARTLSDSSSDSEGNKLTIYSINYLI